MRPAAPEIPRQISPASAPAPLSPRRVDREFRARIARGAELRCVGSARPGRLLAGDAPRYRIDLFDTTYYLGAARQNEDLRLFVGYVVQRCDGAERIHARLF